MIDTADLQAFLGKIGGTVAVDLLKIGQSHHQHHIYSGPGKQNKYNNGKFRIALDMEDCLDRFYGGYYSDWACGGQWNRAYQFVQLLVTAFNTAHIEIIAFYDGTLKENKKLQLERNDFRQKTISVLKHIRMIGTPPPKIWWLPPSGIRTCLRNAMRSINIQVVQTVYDHTMEIIDYYHEHKLDGILGLYPDFIIANTSRYFSSHDLRLSYKGSLETKEYLVSKLLSSLSLTADHLPFIAVFLGGYILIDDTILKSIYQKINVDYTTDFEARIKKIAEIIRNSPTNDIDEFVKHLNLAEYESQIRESVEYYQRRGKFANKKYLGNKKKINTENIRSAVEAAISAPMASETNENDELARKILNDVNNLVDDGEGQCSETLKQESTSNGNQSTKVNIASGSNFIYTLPGEVLKTSLNRHQRGIMDSKIYQLLTKKEILLPQVLEDEQYREVPSVHLFYRPARQMIYAILFNLYHQRYLCSKNNKNQHGGSLIKPDITISEWIWSPQNEYRKPEMVNAIPLPWAVPTIQRLWFGMAFEDKQRRMKAFLTVMRSDSPLMLNRGYVPQHMLVMACVLRYIVTNPERNVLTRQELDAFLATAFSPQLVNVEYTQELVLPGVHLRGVYLATLFMQGIETASLANDACGVPLPWLMTNPWLFFDGKLFHLKLKMSTYVQSLRELCDDHIEIVLKIERFRKAILEDVEHFLLPTHIDHPIYRQNYLPTPNIPQHYNKNVHQIQNIPQVSNNSGASSYYQSNQQTTYYNQPTSTRGTNIATRGRGNNIYSYRNTVPNRTNPKGYQLKVGGVVVGSWAGGAPNRPIANQGLRINRTSGIARYPFTRGRATTLNSRLHRVQLNVPHYPSSSVSRNIVRAYGGKMNRNKPRRNKKEKRPSLQSKSHDDGQNSSAPNSSSDSPNEGQSANEDSKEPEVKLELKIRNLSINECAVELQNGTTVLASDLANSMCDEILKEEDDTLLIETITVSSKNENREEVDDHDDDGNIVESVIDSTYEEVSSTTDVVNVMTETSNGSNLSSQSASSQFAKNAIKLKKKSKNIGAVATSTSTSSPPSSSSSSVEVDRGQSDVPVKG